MNIKTILTSILFITVVSAFITSCKKDSTTNNNNNNGTQTGDIKATVRYTPTTTTSSYTYYLGSSIEVTLKDNNNNTVGTQFVGGTGTVDFGTFNYGTYHVNASGTEMKTSLSTGSTSTNRSLNGSCTVQLSSVQSSCDISL